MWRVWRIIHQWRGQCSGTSIEMEKHRVLLILCKRCRALHVHISGQVVATIVDHHDYGGNLLELAGQIRATNPAESTQLQQLAIAIQEKEKGE